MRIGVIRFPGTNNEHETIRAIHSFQHESTIIDHFQIEALGNYDAYWIAGGFSYADVLRAGAIASTSEIIDEIKKSGKPVFGVCNGFQIMTEAGMLSGALLPNTTTRFVCKWVYIKIENHLSIANKEILRLPIAHFEGNLHENADQSSLPFLYYSSPTGEIRDKFNPNGSDHNIAGLKRGNYWGMMPHPERASFKHQGSTDGRIIIESFLQEVRQ